MVIEAHLKKFFFFFFFFFLANKGFWADLLGVGDFYYELGVQVIEACIMSRDNDGGLTDLDELQKRVKAMRGIQSKSDTNRISE
jgi:ESCRT-II complex subunit VPS22